jgi:hypothetical protein
MQQVFYLERSALSMDCARIAVWGHMYTLQ